MSDYPKTITIRPACMVPARTLDLYEGEEVCETCKGQGQVVWKYTSTGHVYGTCYDCTGDGKRLRCRQCGELDNGRRILHPGRPDLDGLCLKCIRTKLKASKPC